MELLEDWAVLGREAVAYCVAVVALFIPVELPCRDCPGGESDVEDDGLLTSDSGVGTWRSVLVAEGKSVDGTRGVGGEGDASDGFLRVEGGAEVGLVELIIPADDSGVEERPRKPSDEGAT